MTQRRLGSCVERSTPRYVLSSAMCGHWFVVMEPVNMPVAAL